MSSQAQKRGVPKPTTAQQSLKSKLAIKATFYAASVGNTFEPLRVCRKLVGLSYAAKAISPGTA